MVLQNNHIQDCVSLIKKHNNLMQKYCDFAQSIFRHKVITFGCEKILKNGNYYTLGNLVEIIEMYMDEQVYKDRNIFVGHAHKSPGCFFVFPDLYKEQYYNTFRHKLKQKLKIDLNLSVVERGTNYWQVFGWSFQSSLNSIHEDQCAILQDFVKNTHLINAYLEQFKKELLLLDKKESLFSVNWKELDPKFKLESVAIDAQQQRQKISFLLKSKILKETDLYLQNVKFTKREIQCLELYLQGMMISEIGKAIVRSPRTIETHINNIKGKLQANSRNEIFTQAKKLRLLKETNEINVLSALL